MLKFKSLFLSALLLTSFSAMAQEEKEMLEDAIVGGIKGGAKIFYE